MSADHASIVAASAAYTQLHDNSLGSYKNFAFSPSSLTTSEKTTPTTAGNITTTDVTTSPATSASEPKSSPSENDSSSSPKSSPSTGSYDDLHGMLRNSKNTHSGHGDAAAGVFNTHFNALPDNSRALKPLINPTQLNRTRNPSPGSNLGSPSSSSSGPAKGKALTIHSPTYSIKPQIKSNVHKTAMEALTAQALGGPGGIPGVVVSEERPHRFFGNPKKLVMPAAGINLQMKVGTPASQPQHQQSARAFRSVNLRSESADSNSNAERRAQGSFTIFKPGMKLFKAPILAAQGGQAGASGILAGASQQTGTTQATTTPASSSSGVIVVTSGANQHSLVSSTIARHSPIASASSSSSSSSSSSTQNLMQIHPNLSLLNHTLDNHYTSEFPKGDSFSCPLQSKAYDYHGNAVNQTLRLSGKNKTTPRSPLLNSPATEINNPALPPPQAHLDKHNLIKCAGAYVPKNILVDKISPQSQAGALLNSESSDKAVLKQYSTLINSMKMNEHKIHQLRTEQKTHDLGAFIATQVKRASMKNPDGKSYPGRVSGKVRC